MSARMPALRQDLDVMPSPVEDRPGVLVRDPMGFAEGMLVIPPALVPLLAIFDGQSDVADVKAALVRQAGDVRAASIVDHLLESLGGGGFLVDETYASRRAAKERAFAEAAVRAPAHAGSAYPDEPEALARTLDGWLAGARTPRPDLVAIAAPHVSPEGGVRSYAAAFGALDPSLAGRTFVVLGTSHYGRPEAFGLTRKPFATPFGETTTDGGMVAELERAGGTVEDYCHAVEHSIEFQVVFLQHLFGPAVRVVPVLCGPFAAATRGAGLPEDDPAVARFLDALRALADRERERPFFVLGVDLAHVGRRYGDPEAVRAHERGMIQVSERDRDRLERVRVGDATGFWRLVQEDADDLKWCGASPLYAFSRTVARARGELLEYEQWNIDAESVVTFAGLAFRDKEERESR
ncbi:MAG: AmmeMemoRadiSam system protein B [Vicinamibacteria bacterium]